MRELDANKITEAIEDEGMVLCKNFENIIPFQLFFEVVQLVVSMYFLTQGNND